MMNPWGAYRSIGIVLVATIIILQLQNDLEPAKRNGNCHVEAFKVIEFFNRVFNKTPESETVIDIDESENTTIGSGNGTRRRSAAGNDLIFSPWRIFDFDGHYESHHGKGAHHGGETAIIVKRNVGEPEVTKTEPDDSLSARSPGQSSKSKDRSKQHDLEMEKPKRKTVRRSGDVEQEDSGNKHGKWRKWSNKNANESEGEGRKVAGSKGYMKTKASRRGDDDNNEIDVEVEEEDDDQGHEKFTKQKQIRKRKPWFWSRGYKTANDDNEPVEDSSFHKRFNKRIGDIEAWKRMIYCKFNRSAPECSRNDTTSPPLDLFGKFKKFTKRPKNKSSTPASNNATTSASNATTGFTEGSTTEWTRPTTSSFDEGRFATNGTTMAIPTRPGPTTTQSSTTVTTGAPTTTTSNGTTGATSQATTQTDTNTTTTMQPSTTPTTPVSTTVTQATPTQTTTQATTTSQPTTPATTITTTGAPTTTVTTTQPTTVTSTQAPTSPQTPPPGPLVNQAAPISIQPRPVSPQPITLLP